MDASEPKDRLREARVRLKMSREELAAASRRAPSTVRAHENGQNRILPEAAAAYAEALGVTPEWILYGKNALQAQLSVGRDRRVIPVVGEVWEQVHFRPIDQHFSPPDGQGYIYISLPDWEDAKLFAFVFQGPGHTREDRRYLIAAELDPDDAVPPGHQVVLSLREGRLVEIAAWRVGTSRTGERVYFQGENQEAAPRIINAERGAADGHLTVIGLVVAELVIQRRRVWPPSADGTGAHE